MAVWTIAKVELSNFKMMTAFHPKSIRVFFLEFLGEELKIVDIYIKLQRIYLSIYQLLVFHGKTRWNAEYSQIIKWNVGFCRVENTVWQSLKYIWMISFLLFDQKNWKFELGKSLNQLIKIIKSLKDGYTQLVYQWKKLDVHMHKTNTKLI